MSTHLEIFICYMLSNVVFFGFSFIAIPIRCKVASGVQATWIPAINSPFSFMLSFLPSFVVFPGCFEKLIRYWLVFWRVQCPMIAENIINCGAGHHLRATTENGSVASRPTSVASSSEDSTLTFAQRKSMYVGEIFAPSPLLLIADCNCPSIV